MFFVWTCVWRHGVEACVCCLNVFVLKCLKMGPSIVTCTQKVPLQKVGRDEQPLRGCIVFENIMFLCPCMWCAWPCECIHSIRWFGGQVDTRLTTSITWNVQLLPQYHIPTVILHVYWLTPQTTCSRQSIVIHFIELIPNCFSKNTTQLNTGFRTNVLTSQSQNISHNDRSVKTMNSPNTSLTHIIKVLLSHMTEGWVGTVCIRL